MIHVQQQVDIRWQLCSSSFRVYLYYCQRIVTNMHCTRIEQAQVQSSMIQTMINTTNWNFFVDKRRMQDTCHLSTIDYRIYSHMSTSSDNYLFELFNVDLFAYSSSNRTISKANRSRKLTSFVSKSDC
jgi:hypothetical protein